MASYITILGPNVKLLVITKVHLSDSILSVDENLSEMQAISNYWSLLDEAEKLHVIQSGKQINYLPKTEANN